jgi:hypothetical protein
MGKQKAEIESNPISQFQLSTFNFMKQRQTRPATKTTRRRFDPIAESERAARAQEALDRAVTGHSAMNYASIFEGFTAMGIPMEEIKPRENVFTFNAWKALGRSVKKGEHGVRVVSFAPVTKEATDPETGEVRTESKRRAWGSVVFHISQTEEAGKRKTEADGRKTVPAPGSAGVPPAATKIPLESSTVQSYAPAPVDPAPAPAPEQHPEPAPAPKPEPTTPPATPSKPATFNWRNRWATAGK